MKRMIVSLCFNHVLRFLWRPVPFLKKTDKKSGQKLGLKNELLFYMSQ